LLFFESRCVLCGSCEAACPNNVHHIKDGKHYIHRAPCQRCGRCVRSCPTSVSKFSLAGALALPVFSSEPYELFQRLQPQLDLLKRIGGLTICGGEPLLQYQTMRELLLMCKGKDIHTAVETSGSLSKSHFEVLLDVVDCWLFGLRPIPGNSCYSNRVANMKLVIDNLKFLCSHDAKKIIIRTPIIPGFTDSPRELAAIAELMHINKLTTIELLPYNAHTDHFYKAIGKKMPLTDIHRPPDTELSYIRNFFTGHGFMARIVGGEKKDNSNI
jgi:pyruvate-formate lyase-activating enzyme/NAD-dependent dihydropyrimidine dehydrogenase PreA subunit